VALVALFVDQEKAEGSPIFIEEGLKDAVQDGSGPSTVTTAEHAFIILPLFTFIVQVCESEGWIDLESLVGLLGRVPLPMSPVHE
jgi:hypothetical protein